MAHKITFQFGDKGTSEDWNLATYGVIPTGLYSNVTLTKVSSIEISVSTFTAFINDSTKDLSARIESTTLESGIAISSLTPWVVVRLEWQNSASNDFEILSVAVGDIQANDLILGKGNFSGSTLVDFDYTNQSKCILRNDADDLIDDVFSDITNQTSKATVANADEFIINDSADSNNPKKVTKTAITDGVFNEIHTQTSKASVADADEFIINDSADGYTPKRVLQSTVTTGVLAGITDQSEKATIVSGDELVINDSEDANNTKKVSYNTLYQYTVETKTADYTLLSTDVNKLIVANPNTVSQYGLLEMELPLGAAAVVGIPYKIKHGANQGLVKISVNGGGSDKIIYKGEELDYLLLYSKGSNWDLVWDGTDWSCSGCSILKIGWQNRSDWTNVHMGNGVAYDNKSAAVDLTGQVITEATSGFTGIVVKDTGGTGASGILYVYELDSSFTFWTNDRVLTASDGTTCDVDEITGSSKNVDYNLYHGFGISSRYYSKNITISTDKTEVNSFEIESPNRDSGAGGTVSGFKREFVNSASFIYSTGISGIYTHDGSGSALLIATQDYYEDKNFDFSA